MAIINGNNQANVLRGTPNADTIDGRGGDDELFGLAGDDTILTGPGGDELDGGRGLDTLRLSEGSYVDIYGPGGLGDGQVYNNAGDPESSTESDTFQGFERILGSEEFDYIQGGPFDDLASGGDAGDRLLGDVGDDRLYGDQGADRIAGGEGGDRLYGGAGGDSITGDAGDDLLDGGLDRDELDGGTGNDTLVLGARTADVALFRLVPDFSSTASIGSDTVQGFTSNPGHELSIDLRATGGQADADDFLDSNDDGRITAADSEVTRAGGNLVLDLDAVLTRAFGAGDYGTQQITLAGAGAGFDADRIESSGFGEPAGAAASLASVAVEPAVVTTDDAIL